jgi:hypothetical protein
MRSLFVGAVLLTACMQQPNPATAPVPERAALEIAAPVDSAWAAGVELLTRRGLSIRVADRGSGLITTDQINVPVSGQEKIANCGRVFGMYVPAHRATYSVLIRGDSTRSTAQATIRYVYAPENRSGHEECPSTGLWESRLEQEIKQRAERAGQ